VRLCSSDAAGKTFRIAVALLLSYLALAYFLLTHLEPAMRDSGTPITGWYFLVVTLTTVGFGDYAPTKQVRHVIADCRRCSTERRGSPVPPLGQVNRAATVVLVPLGLVCITFTLSFVTAHANARMPPSFSSMQGKQRQWAATTLQAIWRGHKVNSLYWLFLSV